MRVDTDTLEQVLKDKDKTKESVASDIGVSRSTLHRKLKCKGETLSVKDMDALIKAIPLSKREVQQIFLFE